MLTWSNRTLAKSLVTSRPRFDTLDDAVSRWTPASCGRQGKAVGFSRFRRLCCFEPPTKILGNCEGVKSLGLTSETLMLGWWHKRKYRRRLAEVDATILIARYGTRASHIANSRIAMKRNGPVFDSNRPPCHWKRVRSIIRQLLPYDGDDGGDGLLIDRSF
jgi:hypothetical protein